MAAPQTVLFLPDVNGSDRYELYHRLTINSLF